MADKEDGIWRTVGGRRIFIRNGESLTDAMKNSGKFKKTLNKATKKKSKNKNPKNKKSFLDEEQLETLHKHLDQNLEFWKEEGMSNKEILEMLKSPEERPETDDGLWDLKGIDMDDEEEAEAVSKEYLRYVEAKLENRETYVEPSPKKNSKEPNSKQKETRPWEANTIKDKELQRLYNHIEANIKAWREQGMTNQQILDMVKDRQEIAGDDGLYNLKGIDMDTQKDEVLWKYRQYVKSKISTQTRRDYENTLKRFSKIKGDGTYDMEFGIIKDYEDGYQVTFSMKDMDFDDKTYQNLVEKFKSYDHGTVDAGVFDGYSEISFNVTDVKKAAKLATKYNQVSIWDWKNGKVIPTKGTGKFEDYKPESVSGRIKSQRKEKK